MNALSRWFNPFPARPLFHSFSCFVPVLRSITDWVHETRNEISGRSSGVLDFLLKRPVSENCPFKVLNISSHFVCLNEILRETVYKPCMFCTSLVYLQQAYHTGGEMGRMGPISGLATHKNLGNKLNTTQGLMFINIWFDKFIKSVIRLLGEYCYLYVNSKLLAVKILNDKH
jgi:hypothetical protein